MAGSLFHGGKDSLSLSGWLNKPELRRTKDSSIDTTCITKRPSYCKFTAVISFVLSCKIIVCCSFIKKSVKQNERSASGFDCVSPGFVYRLLSHLSRVGAISRHSSTGLRRTDGSARNAPEVNRLHIDQTSQSVFWLHKAGFCSSFFVLSLAV